MCTPKTMKQVIDEQRGRVMNIPEVIGMSAGLSRSGSGEKCIVVYTTSGEWPKGLPQNLENYPVEIQKKTKGFKIL